MGRIVTYVLGLGIVVAVLWYTMYRPVEAQPESAPAQRLENVRRTADQVEADLQKKADDLMKQHARE
jgi:hypothetical protein